MMNENLIYFFALMGAVSLHIVIATIVGRAVYSRTNGWDTDTRFAAAIFCGLLFPISVPIIIFVVWIYSIILGPLGIEKEDEKTTEIDKPKENKSSENKSSVNKTKFKVGDLVTGAEGNPGDYKIFYPGCVCRVIQVYDNGKVELKLVDHIDKKAHEKEIGRRATFDCEDFTLIKPKENKKKVIRKK